MRSFYVYAADKRHKGFPHFSLILDTDESRDFWPFLHVCANHLAENPYSYPSFPLRRWEKQRIRLENYPFAVRYDASKINKIYFKNREDLDAMLMIFSITKGT